MRIYTTKEELLQVACFVIHGKADEKKAESAWALYLRGIANGDSGAFGKAKEILTRLPNSQKVTVAKKGMTDITAKIDGKRVGCECKTNGGRVDNIREKYVVYSINIKNSTGSCDISPRIIRTDVFLAKLYELNAIKAINKQGVLDGYGIQVSKRGLWAWLEEQTEYNREWEYFSEDFEDMGL